MGAMIDGEGTFGRYARPGRGDKQPRLSLGNQSLETISALLRATGVGRVYPARGAMWLWFVMRINDIIDIAHQIAPYSEKAQRFLHE